MVPFGWSRDEDKSVMEKELDRIAEEGVKIVKGGSAASASMPAATQSSTKPKPTTTPKPAPVPARLTLDPVKGKRFLAEAYVSEKGVKSILVGNGEKHARLVFHDRSELVEWLNEARAQLGVDSAALADLHFG